MWHLRSTQSLCKKWYFFYKLGKQKNQVNARVAHQKYDYPALEYKTENLINEAKSLTSMDDSSVKEAETTELKNLISRKR